MAKSSTEIMKCGQFSCALHMPKALPDSVKTHALPPFAPVTAYKVDDYDRVPQNWLHSSKSEGSYFVGVKEGHGMWLNFNDNSLLKHDVAVVVSVQGINPITGQMTSGLKLERYDAKCPVHDEVLDHARCCPQCKFEWPRQNYISTKSTPSGCLWIDGFRAADGVVRQWLFAAADAGVGVAEQILGQNRVFSIGIGFFKSRQPKVTSTRFRGNNIPVQHVIAWEAPLKGSMLTPGPSYDSSSSAGMYGFCADTEPTKLSFGAMHRTSKMNNNSRSYSAGPMRVNIVSVSNETSMATSAACFYSAPATEVPAVNLDVAAGAKIDQVLHSDEDGLEAWEAEAAGTVYVHYTTEDIVRMITADGPRRELQEGFMAKLRVGAAQANA